MSKRRITILLIVLGAAALAVLWSGVDALLPPPPRLGALVR